MVSKIRDQQVELVNLQGGKNENPIKTGKVKV